MTLDQALGVLGVIADEDRPRDWCPRCKAWVNSRFSSGTEYCPDCGADTQSAQEQYEVMAREALAEFPAWCAGCIARAPVPVVIADGLLDPRSSLCSLQAHGRSCSREK